MSKETLNFVTSTPPKNYKISSVFSYNLKVALTQHNSGSTYIEELKKHVVEYSCGGFFAGELDRCLIKNKVSIDYARTGVSDKSISMNIWS